MVLDRHDTDTDTTTRVDRYERERTVGRPPGYVPPTGTSNVNVGPTTAAPVAANPAVWVFTRVVTLLFTVIEVLLLLRFVLKLLGANAQQPLVDGLYRITEPVVRPFQGIFPEPAGPPALDLAALLAVAFFFLIAALIVAIVRAVTGNRAASY
ncbi:MAG TPA: YggT family protein [Candidatus Limnocylindria bacterium]|nr:YggT family protein [Candidatus Limnocylindria bacterium]